MFSLTATTFTFLPRCKIFHGCGQLEIQPCLSPPLPFPFQNLRRLSGVKYLQVAINLKVFC